MAQLSARPAYEHSLVERVVRYLQTKDPSIFPFTASFTPEQRRAFMDDLRNGLAELQDSGSARKTSAAGFIMSDHDLREVINRWYKLDAGWPQDSAR